MPKAYWIAHVTVTDPERYKLYANAAPEAFRVASDRKAGAIKVVLEP